MQQVNPINERKGSKKLERIKKNVYKGKKG